MGGGAGAAVPIISPDGRTGARANSLDTDISAGHSPGGQVFLAPVVRFWQDPKPGAPRTAVPRFADFILQLFFLFVKEDQVRGYQDDQVLAFALFQVTAKKAPDNGQVAEEWDATVRVELVV